MAIGALKAIKETGKRIPEDIKIMAYDDVFLSSVVEPSLSTIHIRKRHTGIKAAEILFHRLENPEDDSDVPIGIKMDANLVIRQSTIGKGETEDWSLIDW